MTLTPCQALRRVYSLILVLTAIPTRLKRGGNALAHCEPAGQRTYRTTVLPQRSAVGRNDRKCPEMTGKLKFNLRISAYCEPAGQRTYRNTILRQRLAVGRNDRKCPEMTGKLKSNLRISAHCEPAGQRTYRTTVLPQRSAVGRNDRKCPEMTGKLKFNLRMAREDNLQRRLLLHDALPSDWTELKRDCPAS